jgi:DNA-binding protein
MAKGDQLNEESTVFVGNKPPMNYVTAVMMEFERGAENVVIKARGRAISRAVDAAEISRNRFLKDVDVSGVKIDTEEVTSNEGEKRNVSSIEITLSKNKK